MSIYKRGRIYWYKFTFNGEAIRSPAGKRTSTRRGIWSPRIVHRWQRAK
jgi:hypothetical protein